MWSMYVKYIPESADIYCILKKAKTGALAGRKGNWVSTSFKGTVLQDFLSWRVYITFYVWWKPKSSGYLFVDIFFYKFVGLLLLITKMLIETFPLFPSFSFQCTLYASHRKILQDIFVRVVGGFRFDVSGSRWLTESICLRFFEDILN
jgi:hypothetical protein